MGLNIKELEQGNIKALFPNLGMVVYSAGCKCEIIGVMQSAGVSVRVIENYKNPTYPIGAILHNQTFLVKTKQYFEDGLGANVYEMEEEI